MSQYLNMMNGNYGSQLFNQLQSSRLSEIPYVEADSNTDNDVVIYPCLKVRKDASELFKVMIDDCMVKGMVRPAYDKDGNACYRFRSSIVDGVRITPSQTFQVFDGAFRDEWVTLQSLSKLTRDANKKSQADDDFRRKVELYALRDEIDDKKKSQKSDKK